MEKSSVNQINKKIYEKKLTCEKEEKMGLDRQKSSVYFYLHFKKKTLFFKYGMDRKSLKYTIYDLVISPDKKVKNFSSHNSHYT